MKICTSKIGWGNKTIRDLIQFATFCAIFAKTRLDSLNDCTVYTVRQAWKRR